MLLSPSPPAAVSSGRPRAATPACALLLPCRGGGPASREEGELCQQAGDRAQLPVPNHIYIKGEKTQSGRGVQRESVVWGAGPASKEGERIALLTPPSRRAFSLYTLCQSGLATSVEHLLGPGVRLALAQP